MRMSEMVQRMAEFETRMTEQWSPLWALKVRHTASQTLPAQDRARKYYRQTPKKTALVELLSSSCGEKTATVAAWCSWLVPRYVFSCNLFKCLAARSVMLTRSWTWQGQQWRAWCGRWQQSIAATRSVGVIQASVMPHMSECTMPVPSHNTKQY